MQGPRGQVHDDRGAGGGTLQGRFGGFGVARIPDLQGLLQYICAMGFEHHVALAMGQVARGIEDALETYFGWDVYHHEA